MLDKAFEALKTYDWGMDPSLIKPIDEAIVATHGDAAARKDLESRLIEVLKSDAPRAAKDAVCRALRTIGTAAAVPALHRANSAIGRSRERQATHGRCFM